MRNTSVNLSNAALDAITAYRKSHDLIKNQTDAINELIIKGKKLEDENKELQRLIELGILKNLHYMRELIRSRGEDVLESFDATFAGQVDSMYATLIKQGIDNYE